ncbi:hypothetical protein NEHOM01_1327 [Nematocida homosporus]|uniref:uncharacterized protein n=1 Tax=Nematocida homosporus TaxID=1912981 RepID=UPI00221EF62D|nr:uncharacterized protein NEHOM01_1327 [Nematocida homosporus]KAI5186162.1 hypothetical protein NEHOM01_1327 [Nematocida homosporus]
MEKDKQVSLGKSMPESAYITTEYLVKLMDKEFCQREKAENECIIKDIEKEIANLVRTKSLDILKDLDKGRSMGQGMDLLNKKLEDLMHAIELSTATRVEEKKEKKSLKAARERVEVLTDAISKLKVVLDAISYLEKLSVKTIVKMEQLLNKREEVSDDEIRGVYLWVRALKEAERGSKYFASYSFYSKLINTVESGKERLLAVANLMTQWWICELMDGLVECAQMSESEKKTSFAYKEFQEARSFALHNQVLIHMGKYIYEELYKKDEFLHYVNNARKRELIKTCKVKIPLTTPEETLKVYVKTFIDFLELDSDIKRIVPQSLDPAIEEYDLQIKKKIETVLDGFPPESVAESGVLKVLKEFFAFLTAHEIYFKDLLEILVQIAYKCISTDSDRTKDKIAAAMKENIDIKKQLTIASSAIFHFLKSAKTLITGVEQAENELDDIILKCINEQIGLLRTSLPADRSDAAVSISGFSDNLRQTLKAEIGSYTDGTTQVDGTLAQKLPELKVLEETEKRILEASAKELKAAMDDVLRQLRIKSTKITSETEITLYSTRVAEILDAYQNKVAQKDMLTHVEAVFSYALQYLPKLQTYRQVDALETDFAILYKSAQYLDLESTNVKSILKLFTEVDCIRKNNKKQLNDPIENDLNDLFKIYKIKPQ